MRREVPLGLRPRDESDESWLLESPRGVPELMELCWAYAPQDRPTAKQVVDRLEAILAEWKRSGGVLPERRWEEN
jgi:hypothetical protein